MKKLALAAIIALCTSGSGLLYLNAEERSSQPEAKEVAIAPEQSKEQEQPDEEDVQALQQVLNEIADEVDQEEAKS